MKILLNLLKYYKFSIPSSNQNISNSIYPTTSNPYVVLKKFSQESPQSTHMAKNDETSNIILEEKEYEKDAPDEIELLDRKKMKERYKLYTSGGRLLSAMNFSNQPICNSTHLKFKDATFSNYLNFWSGKKNHLTNSFFDEFRLPYNVLEDKFTCKSMSPLKMETFTNESSPAKIKKSDNGNEENQSMQSFRIMNTNPDIHDNSILDVVDEPIKIKKNKDIALKIINRSSEDREINRKNNQKKVLFMEETHYENRSKWKEANQLKDPKKSKKLVSHDDVLKMKYIEEKIYNHKREIV